MKNNTTSLKSSESPFTANQSYVHGHTTTIDDHNNSSTNYSSHHLNSTIHDDDDGFHLHLTSILSIALPIVLIAILATSLILIILLRRSKFKERRIGRIDNNSNITDKKWSFAVNSTESPDLTSRCITIGESGGSCRLLSQRRSRGVQVFTYKELEQATDNFNEVNVIGNGVYGVVFRGVLRDGTLAAIKMLHMERKQGQGDRAFRMEVDLLSHLNSPYLVELLGYCADQHHRLLVFEFMSNGSLQHHLHIPTSSSPQLLDWGARLRIALDCARALEYLHEHASPAIIHRDFKCTNVLLDHNLRAKVSDFGLAKLGSDKMNGQISTRVLGTTGYLAPEYVSTGKLTTKSDVYSYGVVLLQLITGRTPIDTTRPTGEHVLVSWALPRLTNREKVVEMIDPAIKGQFSDKDLIQVAAIAAVCVQPEPEYRPLMTDIVQSLLPLVKNLSMVHLPSSRFHSCAASPKL